MSGLNKDYTLGRGKLYFSKFLPGTEIGEGFRFLGNAPAFALSEAIQNLDHYASTEGVRVKDDTVILQLDRTGSITLDSMDRENVAMFTLGNSSVVAQASTTATKETLTVIPGRSYKLGRSLQAAGLGKLVSVVVTDHDTPATTYVNGTDYILDADLGWIDIPMTTGIPVSDKIDVTFNVTAQSFEQIIVPADTSPQEGELFYVAKNPKGTRRNILLPKAQISPNGDFALIGDTWQQMQFNISALIPTDGRPSIIMNGPAIVTP